jgi:hypothetical protein
LGANFTYIVAPLLKSAAAKLNSFQTGSCRFEMVKFPDAVTVTSLEVLLFDNLMVQS